MGFQAHVGASLSQAVEHAEITAAGAPVWVDLTFEVIRRLRIESELSGVYSIHCGIL